MLFVFLPVLYYQKKTSLNNIYFLSYVSVTQAEGVYNQRLQNLAVTLDKVIMLTILLCVFQFYCCTF